jgi:hypothetical protein
MKRIFVVALLASALFSACAGGRGERGNREIVSEERNGFAPFDTIASSGSADIRFHLSEDYRVIVHTDSNIADFVKTESRGGTLHIGLERGSFSPTQMILDVYAPAPAGISISGSGSFSCEDAIQSKTFSVRVSGSGNINLKGESEQADIVISGSGKVRGDDFRIARADIRVSGSGDIDVFVTEELRSRISGSGTIRYSGNPQRVDSSVSGSGRIVKR